MSVLERRVQLLLDQEQYQRVADEAQRSNRSVNAVIRSAIDAHFADETAVRNEALGEFLTMLADHVPAGPAQSWAEIKAEIESDYERTP